MIQPVLCHVEYRLAGEGEEALRVANFDLTGVEAVRAGVDMDLLVEFTDETFMVRVVPTKELLILGGRVQFNRAFSRDERVLLNGYQSWTDTMELSPWARVSGLNQAPDHLVQRFCLDGSGDYRFWEYANKPGYLHGWTYAYCRGDKTGIELVGSLGEDDGFTLFTMNADESRLTAAKEPPACWIGPGTTWTMLNLAYVHRSQNSSVDLGLAFDRWFELMGVTCRTQRPLTGYGSWYRHYGKIDEQKLLRDLYGTCRCMKKLDTQGFDRVFQIDDGYAKVGDWLDYDQDKFPAGMDTMCAAIQRSGFIPGLWCAPFVCEKDSETFALCPDWLLVDEAGEAVGTGSHWSGGYALDTLNPDVREYVTEVIQVMTREWGFKLLKLDFLYAACMVPHGGLNRGQLMADAIRLIRQAAGDDVLLLGCGVPLGSAFGTFDYCRIGCDVGLDWDGKGIIRLTERERVSTKNSLFNTVYRAPLNRRAFMNDPDVLLLRRDVKLTEEQRSLLLEGDACFGGMLLSSDDMESWDSGQVAQFQYALDLMREALR